MIIGIVGWAALNGDGLQETGRAGRDGKVATCVLYYGYQDAVKMRHMLSESAKENNTSPEQQQRNAESVNKMASLSSCSPAFDELH